LGQFVWWLVFVLGRMGSRRPQRLLVGNVVDSAGAAISDAAVTVVNVETKEAYSAKTMRKAITKFNSSRLEHMQ